MLRYILPRLIVVQYTPTFTHISPPFQNNPNLNVTRHRWRVVLIPEPKAHVMHDSDGFFTARCPKGCIPLNGVGVMPISLSHGALTINKDEAA